MIDSILVSIEKNADNVGLALNPEDAYKLEKEGKRAVFIGIENGYPIGSDISNIKLYKSKKPYTFDTCKAFLSLQP